MKRNGLIFIAVLGLVGIIFGFKLIKKDERKIAYIRIMDVYEKFNMRKELESKYKSVEVLRKNIIDSLEFQANNLRKDPSMEGAYKTAVQEYVQKRADLERANEELSEQFEEQIWKQINSYCESYGKECGFDYILGAQGSGVIMYASKDQDITEDVIKYINNTYEGKKK